MYFFVEIFLNNLYNYIRVCYSECNNRIYRKGEDMKNKKTIGVLAAIGGLLVIGLIVMAVVFLKKYNKLNF